MLTCSTVRKFLLFFLIGFHWKLLGSFLLVGHTRRARMPCMILLGFLFPFPSFGKRLGKVLLLGCVICNPLWLAA